MASNDSKGEDNARRKGLSLGKVADYCGVTRKTILRWVKEDILPSFVLPSGHHRVLPRDVAAFLRKHGMPVPEGLVENSRASILVADDDGDVRLVIGRILRDHYEVFEARNGIEACLRLGHSPPNILILDIRMPKMDGLEVCREVRRDPHLAGVKILVLSAHLTDSIRKELDDVVHAVLSKPFNPAEMLDVCNRLACDGAAQE